MLFAPDTEATRALMRAACRLRYAPPGIAAGRLRLHHARRRRGAHARRRLHRRRRHDACSLERDRGAARRGSARRRPASRAATAVARAVRAADGSPPRRRARHAGRRSGSRASRPGRLLVVLDAPDVSAVARGCNDDRPDRDGVPAGRSRVLPRVRGVSRSAPRGRRRVDAAAHARRTSPYERGSRKPPCARSGSPLWTHWARRGVACASLGAAASFGATVTHFAHGARRNCTV